MSYNVIAIDRFEKDIERFVKKHPSLKKEFFALVESLNEDPNQGISIGHPCFKIGLSIASKGKG